jgi:CRISPR type III-B/RAMP module-associated protein Cmr5
MPSIEIERAQRARNYIGNRTGKDAKDFATDCKKTMSRILTSGLAQTVAFMEAKGEYRELINALSGHLAAVLPTSANDNLMNRILAANTFQLRQATDEALALLQWMARLADAQSHAKQ